MHPQSSPTSCRQGSVSSSATSQPSSATPSISDPWRSSPPSCGRKNPVKIVFINAALAALYYGLQGLEILAPDLVAVFDYWAIALLGTVALLLIDLLMNYVYRTLRRVMSKVLRDKHTSEVTAEEIAREDEENKSPFDEFDD